MLTRLAIPVVAAIAIVAVPLRSQERFSFFQASTPESVAQMLKLAALRDDDVVVDLGSGNGLIPLTAARMNPRLRGYGVDIDAKLVAESNEVAKKEGFADRVRFEHRNAFDADLREATVITMWLFPELMRLLRPVILERARPGTRVVTSTWDLGAWTPDATSTEGPPIFLWIVPARVTGGWNWDLEIGGTTVPYSAVFEQQFQKVEGVARAGGRREVLNDVTLRGASIQARLEITIDGLGLTRHEFTGTVEGDSITGSVQFTPANQAARTVPWRAQRTARPRYFEPTGTALLPRPGGAW